MISEERENLLARVSALLAKAASTEHEPERRAFEAKAQALITRYQIDDAELGAAGAMDEREVIVEGWGNATRGVVQLWAGVAHLNRCAVAHRIGRGWARIILAGAEVDAEVTSRLVEHLLPQLRLAILNDRPRSRMSYAVGWASEVTERLGQAQMAAATEVAAERSSGEATSLVPTNTAAAEALASAYELRRGRRTTVDLDAYDSGVDAGQRADIGATPLPGR